MPITIDNHVVAYTESNINQHQQHMESSKTTIPEVTWEYCQDVEYGARESAFNELPVVQAFLTSMGYNLDDLDSGKISNDFLSTIDVTVIEQPTHGRVYKNSDSLYFWHYSPKKEYLGQDRVSFSVSIQGHSFLAVVHLFIRESVNDDLEPSECTSIFGKEKIIKRHHAKRTNIASILFFLESGKIESSLIINHPSTSKSEREINYSKV